MGAPASPSGSRADASSRQGVSTKGFDPSRIGDDLVADALDAQRKEFNSWRIVPCRSEQPDDIHMVCKIYTSAEYVPIGTVTEPSGSFQMERHFLSNQEMAEEYVTHQAMRAALAFALATLA
jgi:hypothetical protein